jgi:hypothetical protein
MTNKIRENAKKFKELSDELMNAAHTDPHGPNHEAIGKRFWNEYDELSYPGGLNNIQKRLKEKDYSVVDGVIEYLKEDPYHFHSGYNKEHMLTLLKHFVLTEVQEQELSKLVIRSVESGTKVIFMNYVRLARRINPELFFPMISVLELKRNLPLVRQRLDILKEVINQTDLNKELRLRNRQ